MYSFHSSLSELSAAFNFLMMSFKYKAVSSDFATPSPRAYMAAKLSQAGI